MLVESTIDIAKGLGGLVFKVFVIVMPLIVFLEWAKTQKWFARFIDSSSHVFSPMGFSRQALFPLMTGVLFGISYGAGVLIPQSRSGSLSRKQVFLVAAFLSLCHAVVEDTLIFVMLGANGWIMVVTRSIAAIGIVYVLSKLSWPSDAPEPVAAEAT